MPYFVYLLICTDGSTYVGATVDLDQRLRRHNKEIANGATRTGEKVDAGESWSRKCFITGFPLWNEALKFEWRWKQLSRKLPKRMNPTARRMKALSNLVALERSTASAIPFDQWEQQPKVNFENCSDPYSTIQFVNLMNYHTRRLLFFVGKRKKNERF